MDIYSKNREKSSPVPEEHDTISVSSGFQCHQGREELLAYGP